MDSRFLEMTTTPMKIGEQHTTPSRVKETGIPKVQAHGGEALINLRSKIFSLKIFLHVFLNIFNPSKFFPIFLT